MCERRTSLRTSLVLHNYQLSALEELLCGTNHMVYLLGTVEYERWKWVHDTQH